MRGASPLWLLGAVAALCAAAAAFSAAQAFGPPREHRISILARQYGYEPHRIFVNTGDTIRLRLISQDVVHGFFLDGHGIEAETRPGKLPFLVRDPASGGEFREVEEVVFTAGRPGKYRYRCSVTCGTLHPFMLGELVVRPNLIFHAGSAGALGVTLAAFGLLLAGDRRGGPAGAGSRRVDLLRRFRWLRRLLTRRWFQFAVVLPNLIVLVFFLVAGLLGSPIGNRNIIVTVVWILWWFLLITALVPLGGRAWCLACPMPFFGEWFSRRRLVATRPGAERGHSIRSGGLNRRWPKRFSNLWVPNILFLCLCSFSTILVTRPALTAAVLGLMILAAVAVHAVYRRRSFCRYLCPLNAWMSLYAMTSMVEVRVRDPRLCERCRERSCVAGSETGWGCPWLVNPSRLDRNNYCGLCMECVKACPNGNPTVQARPFCADTAIRGFDEAWMALIMITLVVAYSVTLLGPWGTIKLWANVTEVGNWAGFALHAAVIWFTALVALPGAWFLAAGLGRRLAGRPEVSAKELFLRYSYTLVPLGLFAWAAFSLPLMMVNYSHITSSLSDPLGWGWDLFGTAGQRWKPLLPELIPYLQVPLLLAGLTIALLKGGSIARSLFPDRRSAARSLLPHGLICTAFTLLLLRLYVG